MLTISVYLSRPTFPLLYQVIQLVILPVRYKRLTVCYLLNGLFVNKIHDSVDLIEFRHDILTNGSLVANLLFWVEDTSTSELYRTTWFSNKRKNTSVTTKSFPFIFSRIRERVFLSLFDQLSPSDLDYLDTHLIRLHIPTKFLLG